MSFSLPVRSGGRAGAVPFRAVEEVGVEAVLEVEQQPGWLAALPMPDDVAEIVEAFDAGSGDDQGLGGGIVMCGEACGVPGGTISRSPIRAVTKLSSTRRSNVPSVS